MKYMKNKGVDTSNKKILITNGFTEGFDIVLSSLIKKGIRYYVKTLLIIQL